MAKAWQCATVDSGKVEISQELSLHPVAAGMLAHRGLFSSEEIGAFLSPSWEKGVHDPFLFKSMPQAVDRIFKAIESKQRVVIHGDYDADGVTGSAVLAETLKMLISRPEESIKTNPSDKFFSVLKNLDIYIPHREKEGYGLNAESVELIAARGANLLITVDCGIANVEEIKRARELGMDVVVVDHHQFGEQLPDAILIHPKLPGEIYPFKDLAAVGVAWKLACALMEEGRNRGYDVPLGAEKWLLDLVAIATITDIVPLVGENRVLEKFGLVVLNKLRRPGIRALVEAACWKRGELDSESIGFVLGPRINAAGRMEHAYLAVDLLLEENSEEAARKAAALETINRSRQKATETLMKEAQGNIQEIETQALIFAWSENWSPSLVGLAAGRFTDAWGKPAVFVGKYQGVWIGSGRSIPNYDITAAVRDAGQGLLTRYGGHTQACGFSLAEDEHVRQFAEALRSHAATKLVLGDLKPFLNFECELKLDDIEWLLLDTLKLFEPFGDKNPKPLFATYGLRVLNASLVGASQNHIRAILKSPSGRTQKFMGFYRADLAGIMEPGAQVDVVYEIGSSEWNGNREIQCKIVDAKKSN
ncbi:MAG: single-stranded-DNA-specific exonuclease RecJ [Patescibacteria group bacterium]|nr:single-stranded-DNA-specific exonuclease RecJ [Patescibacteria group bacterium]